MSRRQRLIAWLDGEGFICSLESRDDPPDEKRFERRADLQLDGLGVLPVYVERRIPSAREVAEAFITHHGWDDRNFENDTAQPGSPFDIARRWHRAGRP